MEVVSLCPLKVASLAWRSRPREWALTVVCKATFDLLPGVSRLAGEQEYPSEEDNHWNDDAARSLYVPSDMAPFKLRADIMLVGHAFAPGGRPARSLVARMVVGDVSKSIEAHLERWWSQDGLLCEGARFSKMPLRYERAGGGPDSWNPVGIASDAGRDMYGKAPVPNLQHAGVLISEPGTVVEPVGFGPIAPFWPQRRDRVHVEWSPSRLATEPLPAEVEPAFFNAAPTDQQTSAIRGNERIVLENLHPEHPTLATNLPGLVARAFRQTPAGPEEINLVGDTLWIDTDRGICTLVWRGRTSITGPEEPGRIVVGLAKEGERLSFADFTAQQAQLAAAPAPSLKTSPESTVDESSDVAPMTARATVTSPETSPVPRRRAAPATMALPASMGNPDHGSAPPPPSTAASGAQALPFLPSSTPRAPSQRGEPRSGALPFAPVGRASAPPSGAAAYPSVPPDPAPTQSVAPAPVAPSQVPPAAATPSAGIRATASSSPWASGSPSGQDAPAEVKLPSPASVAAPSVVPSGREGAIAHSNAAAAASVAATSWSSATPPTSSEESRVPVPKPARGVTAHEVIDLLWLDADYMRRVREKEEWLHILEQVAPEKPDIGFDEEAPPEIPQEELDRKDCFGILTRGAVLDGEGVIESIGAAVEPDGSFTPPLVLVQGELQFPFDEIEQLKAMVTAIKPIISGDAKLQSVVDSVEELLQTPWLQSSGTVAEGQIQRLKDAFSQSSTRMVSPSYLEQHTERVLLEDRHYQRRTVYGDTFIRALLAPFGASNMIPTYLAEDLAKQLPMFTKLKVRLICEATGQQDQYEKHNIALRLVALGRVLPIMRR